MTTAAVISDEAIQEHLQLILSECDLTSTSLKSVKEQLETFFGQDLTGFYNNHYYYYYYYYYYPNY